MTREQLWAAAAERYGAAPEFLWARYPRYAVLRRADSRKWFGVIMDLEPAKLGLAGQGRVDVLEVKADPLMIGSLLTRPGILPAYHLKKGSWLTLLLDGTLDGETLLDLLDVSFVLAAPHKGGPHAGRTGT